MNELESQNKNEEKWLDKAARVDEDTQVENKVHYESIPASGYQRYNPTNSKFGYGDTGVINYQY